MRATVAAPILRIGQGAAFNGRAPARNATATLGVDAITNPSCTASATALSATATQSASVAGSP